MTEPNLLKQAKEGDAVSIAALMNHSLKPKGIQAKAVSRGDRLFIRLEAHSLPDQSLLTKFVRSGIQNLNPATVRVVEVSGQEVGSDRPAWTSVIDLKPQAAQPTTRPHPSPSPTPSPSPQPATPVAPPPAPTADVTKKDANEDVDKEDVDKEDVDNDVTAEQLPTEMSGVKTRFQGGDTHIPGLSQPEPQASTPPPMPSSAPAAQTSDAASWVEDVADDIDNVASLRMDSPDSEWSIDADVNSLTRSDGAADAPEARASEESDRENFDDDFHSVRRSRSLVPTDLSKPLDFSSSSSTSSKSSAASGILFVAVLLVMLGATGGLIGYALWSYFDGGGSISDPSITVPSADDTDTGSADTETETGAPREPSSELQITDAERLQEAAEKAESATTLAQSAQSGDDWNLVANQWQRAIDQLETIPESSPEYGAVQQQLATYRNQLAAAQQQASSLANATSAPLPSTVVATNREPECEAIAPNNAQPLELSAVRFAEEEPSENRQVLGCITNHGDQAIASAVVEYAAPNAAAEPAEEAPEGEGAEAPNAAQTTTLQFSELQPGATVPFTASLSLPADQSSIQITRVTWIPAGASESQSIEVAVPLSATN